MSADHQPQPEWGWPEGQFQRAGIDFPHDNVLVTYHRGDGRDAVMRWEFFAGSHTVTGMCPHCSEPENPRYILFQASNRRFYIDRGRMTVEEKFRCNYCRHPYRLTDGVMQDV